MRRLRLACIVLVWMASACGGGQIRRGLQEDGADVVREALGGRSLVVRVYPDPLADPRRFEKINIPMTDDTVRSSAIKAACPWITESSLVFFWAADQTDRIIGMALGRGVYARRYTPDTAASIWMLLNSRQGFSPWWTFLDAEGKPIPGATVEAWLSVNDSMSEIMQDAIPLGKATLDEQGRLRRWLCWGSGRFVLKVEHPDYGIGKIDYLWYGEPASGVCFVPLIRQDSQAARPARGLVIDSDGKPVPNTIVALMSMGTPNGTPDFLYGRVYIGAVTDTNGRFALCMPMLTDKREFKAPPEPGTRYHVHVEPPRDSHLRRQGVSQPLSLLAGTETTITLTRMDTQEAFHTFSFEFVEGPVTSIDELRQIELVLRRDNREWARLRYDQWKDGCSLPMGTLQAGTTRWGKAFSFQEVVLTTESPEHLVIQARPPIICRGHVIDAITKELIPGALVLSGYPQNMTDPCALTDEQWHRLRDDAARQANDRTPQALYRWQERAAVTDANGTYEVVFMPGLSAELGSFSILVPGYRKGWGPARPLAPKMGETVTYHPIPLMPLDYRKRMPAFVFEDETGPVTDPEKLKLVRLIVSTPDNRNVSLDWPDYAGKPDITPGVHRAEAMWDGKYYTFEPVDLSRDVPQTVVFRPQRIDRLDVVIEGQIIDGATGSPIAGAVVAYCGPMNRDASVLTNEDWAAIHAAGARMDPGDPNLAPLTRLFAREWGGAVPDGDLWLTQTDADGRYALAIHRTYPGWRGRLQIAARDFIPVWLPLVAPGLGGRDESGRPVLGSLQPDDSGTLRFNLLRLVPAGTVLIHPIVPDAGHEAMRYSKLVLGWNAASGLDGSVWMDVRRSLSAEGRAVGMSPMLYLQPNVAQSCYLPADMDLGINLLLPGSKIPSVRLPSVRLTQGQVLDLGRVEMDPGVQVAVKVVDRAGRPVPGVQVNCRYNDTGHVLSRERTDASGIVRLNVPAPSAGTFHAVIAPRANAGMTGTSVPYQIAGPEDAGKVFVLTLSDDAVRLLLRGKP